VKAIIKFPIYIIGALLAVSAALAGEPGVRQDSRALDVLKSMSAYKASLDRVVIKSVNLTDARLGSGLLVSNSTEVKVSIERPHAMHISSFDGVNKMELYFHDGTLTVYGSEQNYYAQANIPKDIDAAMEFALEELGVEAPLMDLIYHDASAHLIGSQETILYLTDKARIAGKDCHHIAIRGAETDVQLWVQEGELPLLRKIVITSKWEGGSPRFTANLMWDTNPDFDPEMFKFEAPAGSTNIGFTHSNTSAGE
jgi:hypothetical protein